MNINGWLVRGAVSLAALVGVTGLVAAAEEADPALVEMAIELLADPDQDIRALGFEQVRTAGGGREVTLQFAAQLPKLSPEGQVGLLSALADRGDAAARDVVLQTLSASKDESVQLAALEALGPLGESNDAHLLVKHLATGSAAAKAVARASLVQLAGDEVHAAIIEEMAGSSAPTRVALIQTLTTRRALEAVSFLLTAAADEDAAVRTAAMASLAEMASPEHVPGMLRGVLKAPAGKEREAAERAVASVCGRIEDAAKQADPLWAAMQQLSAAEQLALLPGLGRVGGPTALEVVEAAIASSETKRHEAGLRALCNWPNASVAPRLIELTSAEPHPAHQAMALRALIRVAPLADGRSDAERLALLKQAFELCQRDEERRVVLQRAAAVRTMDSLAFLMPFLDQPALAQTACLAVVELAHHRPLREPNKAAFHAVLDKVLEISTDATVRDRATRYKNGQTWARPKAPAAG